MRASEVAALAVREIGVLRYSDRHQEYLYDLYGDHRDVAWCMCFVQFIFRIAGVALPLRSGSCKEVMNAAIDAGMWVTSGYRVGDIAIFDWPSDPDTDPNHTGIIVAVGADTVITIEGNTEQYDGASGVTGVWRRERPKIQMLGAVRPAYDEETAQARYRSAEDCPGWAQGTVRKLIAKGALVEESLDLSEDMLHGFWAMDKAGILDLTGGN